MLNSQTEMFKYKATYYCIIITSWGTTITTARILTTAATTPMLKPTNYKLGSLFCSCVNINRLECNLNSKVKESHLICVGPNKGNRSNSDKNKKCSQKYFPDFTHFMIEIWPPVKTCFFAKQRKSFFYRNFILLTVELFSHFGTAKIMKKCFLCVSFELVQYTHGTIFEKDNAL